MSKLVKVSGKLFDDEDKKPILKSTPLRSKPPVLFHITWPENVKSISKKGLKASRVRNLYDIIFTPPGAVGKKTVSFAPTPQKALAGTGFDEALSQEDIDSLQVFELKPSYTGSVYDVSAVRGLDFGYTKEHRVYGSIAAKHLVSLGSYPEAVKAVRSRVKAHTRKGKPVKAHTRKKKR